MPCPKEASFFQRNRTISALMDLSRRSHRFGYREHGRTPVLPAPFHAYWVIQISSGAEQASQKSRWQETKLQRRVNGGTRFEVRWKEKKRREKKREERRNGVVFERHTIFDSNVESKTFAIQKNDGKERKERERENDLNQRVWRYREEERSNHRKLPFRDDRVEYVIQKVPIVCPSCHKIPGERPVTAWSRPSLSFTLNQVPTDASRYSNFPVQCKKLLNALDQAVVVARGLVTCSQSWSTYSKFQPCHILEDDRVACALKAI